MATLTVRGFTVIRDIFGSSAISVTTTGAETVGGVLQTLLERYGAALESVLCEPNGRGLTAFPIKLNDEIISSSLDADRAVKSGDEMTIIFPVGGGR